MPRRHSAIVEAVSFLLQTNACAPQAVDDAFDGSRTGEDIAPNGAELRCRLDVEFVRHGDAARLTVLLRHMTFRAISQRRMEKSRVYESFGLAQDVSGAGRKRAADAQNGARRVFPISSMDFTATSCAAFTGSSTDAGFLFFVRITSGANVSVAANGDVRIGTTLPAAKLNVDGSVKVKSYAKA